MAGLLELELAGAPDTVLESEGMGRERRVRRFHFGDSGQGRGRSATAAMEGLATTAGSSWGAELTGGRECKNHPI